MHLGQPYLRMYSSGVNEFNRTVEERVAQLFHPWRFRMAGVFQMTARHGRPSGLGRLDMFSDVHLGNSRPGGPLAPCE